MKRLAYALFAAVVLATAPAVAGNNALDGPRAFGIGVGGNGWTSGLSGKLFLGGNVAAQAIVGNCGWGWYYDERGYYRSSNTLCAGADLIFEEAGVGRGPIALNWNYGLGGGVVGMGGSSVGVAFNGVVGGSLQILQRVELNVEWRPTVYGGGGGLSWALFASGGNLRIYF